MSLTTSRPAPLPATPLTMPRNQLAMRPRPAAVVKAGSSTLTAKPRPPLTQTVVSRPPSNPTTAKASPSSMPPPPLPPQRKDSSSSTTSTISTPTTSSPAASLLVPGKDTSSSAGKVFAKPSKEWVLPERAKPGRKVSSEEPENRRQSQNRISQRAHRARKTDYVQTLEDRLRAYEADEIHSNVRLQEVARALKADNERMKVEVATLRGKVLELEKEAESSKREKDEEIRALREEVERLRSASGEKMRKSTADSRVGQRTIKSRLPEKKTVITPIQTSISLNRPVVACPICPDPDPDCPCQQSQTALHLDPTLVASAVVLTSMTDPSNSSTTISAPPTPQTSCGLCESTEDCLCTVVSQPKLSPTVPLPSAHTTHADADACGLCMASDFCACRQEVVNISPPRSTRSVASTISSAVPLRQRSLGIGGKRAKPSIWALESPNLHSLQSDEAVCSGDPSNCDACRNDVFGQEFCARLAEATSHSHASSTIQRTPGTGFTPCSTCPGNCMAISNILSPPSPPYETASTDGITIKSEPGTIDIEDSENETMRCDEAWKAIKAHPKATFSSLSMLADVVARRTKCVGPRVELSPPPESRAGSPAELGVVVHMKRRLEVETSGVRDALRLLDQSGDESGCDRGRGEKRRKLGL